MCVSMSVAVTSAPEISAPDESVTRPRIEPDVTCASAGFAQGRPQSSRSAVAGNMVKALAITIRALFAANRNVDSVGFEIVIERPSLVGFNVEKTFPVCIVRTHEQHCQYVMLQPAHSIRTSVRHIRCNLPSKWHETLKLSARSGHSDEVRNRSFHRPNSFEKRFYCMLFSASSSGATLGAATNYAFAHASIGRVPVFELPTRAPIQADDRGTRVPSIV